MKFSFFSSSLIAPEFKIVQKEVSELISGRVLIGHAVHHDLKVIKTDTYMLQFTQ